MQQVNVRELKARLSFWLNNLPIEVTKNGKVVATLSRSDGRGVTTPTDHGIEEVTTEQPEPAPTAEAQTDKIAALRALIAPLEGKVDTSTGEIQPPAVHKERRRYTEYDDQRGEDILIEGTFDDFRIKCGSKGKAMQTWRLAKPVK